MLNINNFLEPDAKYKIIIYQDITLEAKKILSAVRRAELNFKSVYEDGEHIGLSRSLITRVLHGGKDKRILEMELYKLSVYGIMSDMPRRKIRGYIDDLITLGYLYLQESEFTYTRLRCVLEKAEAVFKGEEVLIERENFNYIGEHKSRPSKDINLSGDDLDLYNELREVRMELAIEADFPPFIIFHNSVLKRIAIKRPSNISELASISGVGKNKAEKYGEKFLNKIAKWLSKN